MQEQLTWADRNAMLERLPARNGELHWHWSGGSLLGITDEMLKAHFGPKREWFAGQVIRFGPYHVQLMQRCSAELGWLARRM